MLSGDLVDGLEVPQLDITISSENPDGCSFTPQKAGKKRKGPTAPNTDAVVTKKLRDNKLDERFLSPTSFKLVEAKCKEEELVIKQRRGEAIKFGKNVWDGLRVLVEQKHLCWTDAENPKIKKSFLLWLVGKKGEMVSWLILEGKAVKDGPNVEVDTATACLVGFSVIL